MSSANLDSRPWQPGMQNKGQCTLSWALSSNDWNYAVNSKLMDRLHKQYPCHQTLIHPTNREAASLYLQPTYNQSRRILLRGYLRLRGRNTDDHHPDSILYDHIIPPYLTRAELLTWNLNGFDWILWLSCDKINDSESESHPPLSQSGLRPTRFIISGTSRLGWCHWTFRPFHPSMFRGKIARHTRILSLGPSIFSSYSTALHGWWLHYHHHRAGFPDKGSLRMKVYILPDGKAACSKSEPSKIAHDWQRRPSSRPRWCEPLPPLLCTDKLLDPALLG